MKAYLLTYILLVNFSTTFDSFQRSSGRDRVDKIYRRCFGRRPQREQLHDSVSFYHTVDG